jgi:hypothetical protein
MPCLAKAHGSGRWRVVPARTMDPCSSPSLGVGRVGTTQRKEVGLNPLSGDDRTELPQASNTVVRRRCGAQDSKRLP